MKCGPRALSLLLAVLLCLSLLPMGAWAGGGRICSGMKTYTAMTCSEAISRGCTKCKNCF